MAKRPENAVADHREAIAELKAARAEVLAQPTTPSEAETRIDRYLAGEAAQYRERATVERLKHRGAIDDLGTKDNAFFAFYFREPIKAALMAEMAEGIAQGDRAAEIERIDTDLYAAERAEEQAICEAEARGHSITRRADADPRTVLSVE